MLVHSNNQPSFKGLWEGPISRKSLGYDPHCKCGEILKEEYIYRPFKNETKESIQNTLKKENNSAYELDDLRDQDPFGPEAYFLPEVKLGKTLNITAEEYNEIMNLQQKLYEDNSISEYTVRDSKARERLLSLTV